MCRRGLFRARRAEDSAPCRRGNRRRGLKPPWDVNQTTAKSPALAAAVAGAVLGHFLFLWIARQGFYALALPGALAGLGAALVIRLRSLPLAAAVGVIGLVAGVFSEWRFAPFIADGSLGYFLAHLQELRPVTLIFIALGGGLGFWFALGRTRSA